MQVTTFRGNGRRDPSPARFAAVLALTVVVFGLLGALSHRWSTGRGQPPSSSEVARPAGPAP